MAKEEKTKVYLILCEGQGDEHATLVDQETWDWINKPRSKPPAAMIERRKKLDGVHFDEPEITSGSAVNDAALYAPGIDIDGVEAHWFEGPGQAFRAAKNFARKHKLEIVDTFEGYIY